MRRSKSGSARRLRVASTLESSTCVVPWHCSVLRDRVCATQRACCGSQLLAFALDGRDSGADDSGVVQELGGLHRSGQGEQRDPFVSLLADPSTDNEEVG